MTPAPSEYAESTRDGSPTDCRWENAPSSMSRKWNVLVKKKLFVSKKGILKNKTFFVESKLRVSAPGVFVVKATMMENNFFQMTLPGTPRIIGFASE